MSAIPRFKIAYILLQATGNAKLDLMTLYGKRQKVTNYKLVPKPGK